MGIKLVMVGAAAAGKTSLINRFIHRKFGQSYRATIGADFMSKMIDLDSRDARVNLQMWDLGGQEKYSNIAPLYFRNTHVVLITFDVTDASSIQSAEFWYEKAQRELKKYDYMADIMFVANKCDSEKRCDYSRLEDMCIANVVGFREVSAKTGENVSDVILEMLEYAFDKRSKIKKIASDKVNLEEIEIDDSCCSK